MKGKNVCMIEFVFHNFIMVITTDFREYGIHCCERIVPLLTTAVFAGHLSWFEEVICIIFYNINRSHLQ